MPAAAPKIRTAVRIFTSCPPQDPSWAQPVPPAPLRTPPSPSGTAPGSRNAAPGAASGARASPDSRGVLRRRTPDRSPSRPSAPRADIRGGRPAPPRDGARRCPAPGPDARGAPPGGPSRSPARAASSPSSHRLRQTKPVIPRSPRSATRARAVGHVVRSRLAAGAARRSPATRPSATATAAQVWLKRVPGSSEEAFEGPQRSLAPTKQTTGHTGHREIVQAGGDPCVLRAPCPQPEGNCPRPSSESVAAGVTGSFTRQRRFQPHGNPSSGSPSRQDRPAHRRRPPDRDRPEKIRTAVRISTGAPGGPPAAPAARAAEGPGRRPCPGR